MNKPVRNLSASVHQKLLNKSHETGQSFNELIQYYGFEFSDRPELSRLRREYSSDKRRAHVVVIEHLDRLSRNADWHQGYLLDEMKQFGLRTVFWKQFSSRIERVVMGAVAQTGMENEKLRMAQGKPAQGTGWAGHCQDSRLWIQTGRFIWK